MLSVECWPLNPRSLNAIPTLGGGKGFEFFVRPRVTVRAKGARVNSVFLVQLRKNVEAYFYGVMHVNERASENSWEHWMALFSSAGARRGENPAERGGGMSTGRAQEMQKGEGSCQWLVVSCQFLARICVWLQELPERKLTGMGGQLSVGAPLVFKEVNS